MQFCVLTVQVCVITEQVCVFTVQICVITVQIGGKENLHVKNKYGDQGLANSGGGHWGGGGVLWNAIPVENREIPQHCCVYVNVDKHVDRNILHIYTFIVHVDKISGLPSRHLFLEQASNHLQDMQWLYLTFHDYILIERIHHLYVLWWNTSLLPDHYN